MEFNPRPAPNEPERPWIGDLPGEGSQGPSDLPQKTPCPHCGGTGHSDKDGRIDRFEKKYPGYRGEQQGRTGHFGAGWGELPVGTDGSV